jgi:hypothetical protein
MNVHFHMLFLDGVYVENGHGKLCFHRVKAPNVDELKSLVHAISHRVARFLEKRGFLERDADDCMDAGGRAPKVGASGDAWSSCREQLPGAGTG